MVLGGIQKSSLIDYPGKVSCVFFLSGCNFDCPYCHNPDLARGCSNNGISLEEQDIDGFLEKRKGFLDGVVISGGEPTLNPDLLSLCRSVKKIGYSVKLDTNGSRPDMILRLINEGLVDYIAMDIKTDPVQYSSYIKKDFKADRLLQSIAIIMHSAPAYEFRTTCVKPVVDASIIKSIAKRIDGAERYALQRFRDCNVMHPEYFIDRDASYSDDDMENLRSIADPWVRECIIR